MDFTSQTNLVVGDVISNLKTIWLKVVPVMEYIVIIIAKIGKLKITLLRVTVIKLTVFIHIIGLGEQNSAIIHLQDTQAKTYT